MIESTQYLLPDGLDAAALSRALAPTLALRADSIAAGERSFYDTFDGRLHRAGLSLVHEAGRLALLEGGHSERAGAHQPRPPKHLLAADLPTGRLRELLLPLVERRALTRLVLVQSRKRPLRVLDDEHKTVVRLVLEEPCVVGDGEGVLRPRLHAIGVLGYDKELRRVRGLLETALGLVAADVSLRDEAAARAGASPAGVTSKPRVSIEPDERSDRAAGRILQALLEVIEANLPGAVADLDSEFLHDLRVSVRKTRSLLRQLRPAFPAEPLHHFRAEFRWLQRVTGPSRDLDVYVLEFDDFSATLPEQRRAELGPLRELLIERRVRERRRMVGALRSERTGRLLTEWREFLTCLEEPAAAVGPAAEYPAVQLASARIAKVYKRIVKAGKRIDDSSPPPALHELRKQGKELRYLLELFTSLYPAHVTKPMLRTLRALQEILGRFQDREVQAQLIRSLGEEVRTRDDGAAALLAMGQLVDRVEEQQAEARARFAERFAAFASSQQRARVRETFT